MTDDAFEILADRATARLSADPELRLDVRRELLTHLHAARADHAAGGDAHPAAAAMASLGEPDELADRLFRTHRRRLLRRRLARMAVSAFAWPLGLVLTHAGAGHHRDAAGRGAGGGGRRPRLVDAGRSLTVAAREEAVRAHEST